MTAWKRSLTSGAAGALALTALHEMARRRLAHAPRMDVVGMRGLRRVLPDATQERLDDRSLHRLTLAGDLVSNSLYYATIAAPTAQQTWGRAIGFGVAAGAGALLLPERMGLGTPPHSEHRSNQAMTVAWYLAGALVAGAVATLMAGADPRDQDRHHVLARAPMH